MRCSPLRRLRSAPCAGLLAAPLLFAAACSGEKGDTAGSFCDASAASAGEALAEINSGAWRGPDATWVPSGDGVQVTTSIGDGYRMTLVAYGVQGAISEGRLPLTLTMDAAGLDAWAVVYPESGSSFSSKAGEGGSLTLSAVEGDLLSGCFEFGAAAGDEALRVSGGSFLANPL